MSFRILSCFLILFSVEVFGETFTSRLQEIAPGGISEKILLFADGRIAWVKGDSDSYSNLLPGQWYHVLTNERVEVEKIAALALQKQEMEINPSFSNDNDFYTNVLNKKVAEEIYSKLELFPLTAASSDRTHLWAYHLYKKFDLVSSKFFLFPSLDQIKNNKLKFWYYVGLNFKDEKGEAIFFDPSLSTKPLSFSLWIDSVLIENDDCRIETIHSFEFNKNKCQMINLNMFYRRPIDIIRLQIQEFIRSHFYDSEIDESRFSVLFPG